MAQGHKPNPFSKVTEETFEPEHERRLIRTKAVADRKMAEKRAQAARDGKPADVPAAANKGSSPSTPSPATTVKKLPSKAKVLPPVRKKRSGLRGVALTFGHYGVKKVVRRPSALLMESAKVPSVPPLPGQEDVPVTDSEPENGDADNDAGDNTSDDSPDAGGKPDGWEQGSQASTVIEEASDREDFDVEFGVPGGPAVKANQFSSCSEPLVESNTTLGYANQPVALDEQFGSGLPADNIPAPVPAFNLPPPAPASHGRGMFQQLPAKHPFGPAQTMDAGYFGPDEMAMMDMPFPNDPSPAGFPNHSQEVPAWSWNADFVESDNIPNTNVPHAPNSAFGTGSAQPLSNTPFVPPNQFDPQASSFLEQLGDHDQPPELNSAPYEPANHAPASAPASPFLHADARPIAPLPRPRVPTTAPSTPRVSSSHLTPDSHVATPTTAQVPTQSGHYPNPSFSLLANDHARAFTRSYSAPFETPVRPSALQPSYSRTLTRPGTPIGAIPSPNDSVSDSPPSPFEAMVPISAEQEDSHAEAPDPTEDGPSARLHMSKRIRLIPPTSHAPTLKEIRLFKSREYAAIRKKRKYGTPSKKEKPPRVGTYMGLFAEEHQEYMYIFRSSLAADMVMISPWWVPEAEMVERAIVRSDAATGLRREDVVKGKFEATALRGLSTCRSQFCDPVLQLVRSGFKVSGKAAVQPLLAGDRFMYPSDAKHPRDFADTPVMREVTVELFFGQLYKLGGLYMEDMLQEDSLEARRSLLTYAASAAGETVPSSFNYADMSPDALRGPPLASLAFAGISILHGLKKIAGTAGNFDEANYGEAWGRYVFLLASHPRLGTIRAALFEEIKLRYSSVYCQGTRHSTIREPRAWVWK